MGFQCYFRDGGGGESASVVENGELKTNAHFVNVTRFAKQHIL